MRLINIVIIVIIILCNYPSFFPNIKFIGGGAAPSFYDKMFSKLRYIYIHKAIKLYFYQYVIKTKQLNKPLLRVFEVIMNISAFVTLQNQSYHHFLIDQIVSTILIEIYIYKSLKFHVKFNEYVVYLLIMIPYSCVC